MSSEYPSQAHLSSHIPLAILSGAIAIFLAVQLRNNSKQAEIMRWQLGNLDKQTENLAKAKTQFAEALVKSEDTVKQADQVQGQYVQLFNDLLDLSKDDKDAKDVVDKWGIKRSDPAKTDAAETKEK